MGDIAYDITYELTMIIYRNTNNKIFKEKMINLLGEGNILSYTEVGPRDLMYTIKNQTSAKYVTIRFLCYEEIYNIEKQIKKENEILKYIIMR